MTSEDYEIASKSILHEDAHFDFKSSINWNISGEIIELFKDIISMANSGGGAILLGVNDDGSINEAFDRSNAMDHADIVNKLKKYIDFQFYNFRFKEIDRNGKIVLTVIVDPSRIPIVFTNPGTYETEGKGQKTAFGRGTIYFRHGAKSEPANHNDLENAFSAELDRVKLSWLGNIRKVVEAPVDHIAYMAPPNVTLVASQQAIPIRITDDAEAPAYKIQNPDEFCPYRQKEVIQKVNSILGSNLINGYDVTAINHVFGIDSSKPDYFYKSNFGPKQYSQLYVDFIIDRYKSNINFFFETRENHRSMARNV